MKCPACGADGAALCVIDSRPMEETVRRRRSCTKCGGRFTTYEITQQEYEIFRDIRDYTMARIARGAKKAVPPPSKAGDTANRA